MRMRMLRTVLISMIAALCCGRTAEATTWIVPEQEEMLESADAVVLATVSDLRSIEAFDGSQISTEITLKVHERYQGADGVLHTQHLGIGKVGARVANDGKVWLSRVSPTGHGKRIESLGHFSHR